MTKQAYIPTKAAAEGHLLDCLARLQDTQERLNKAVTMTRLNTRAGARGLTITNALDIAKEVEARLKDLQRANAEMEWQVAQGR